MEHKENQGLISRRGMLKSIGMAGAAAVSAPILHVGESALRAATTPADASKTGMKVGILIPGSGEGGYSSNFLNGFHLYLSQRKEAAGSVPFTPFVEEIGVGAFSANAKLGKLIGEHNIDIAVGLMNSHIVQYLVPTVEKAGINFIEANLGENFFHKDLASDRFFQSSLNLWQSHYTLGEYAAHNIGTTAISASSFIDSGYDALYAFEAGFKSAGGIVTRTIISGNPSDNLSPVETAALCANSDARIVFANYSGSDAAIFLSAFKNSGGSETKKIVVSAMMMQPRLLRFIGDNALGAISALSWNPSHSETFVSGYRAKYGSEADDFSLLGYDTATMLCSVSDQVSRSVAPSNVARAMNTMEFDSPRGVVKINAGTHSLESAVSIVEMKHTDGAAAIHVLSTGNLANAITSSKFRLTDEVRSGSVLPYPNS